jgi:hypothetical protein
MVTDQFGASFSQNSILMPMVFYTGRCGTARYGTTRWDTSGCGTNECALKWVKAQLGVPSTGFRYKLMRL